METMLNSKTSPRNIADAFATWRKQQCLPFM